MILTSIGTMTKHLNAKALMKQQQEQQWISVRLPVYLSYQSSPREISS
jgi:hypothetical protein